MEGGIGIHLIPKVFLICHHAVNEAGQNSVRIKKEEMGRIDGKARSDFFSRGSFCRRKACSLNVRQRFRIFYISLSDFIFCHVYSSFSQNSAGCPCKALLYHLYLFKADGMHLRLHEKMEAGDTACIIGVEGKGYTV